MPDVSVIVATLNGASTIGKSIKSAQDQTVRDIEIIVVDDGSTDGTRDLVAARAAKDTRIKCVRLPQNLGVGGARNADPDGAVIWEDAHTIGWPFEFTVAALQGVGGTRLGAMGGGKGHRGKMEAQDAGLGLVAEPKRYVAAAPEGGGGINPLPIAALLISA